MYILYKLLFLLHLPQHVFFFHPIYFSILISFIGIFFMSMYLIIITSISQIFLLSNAHGFLTKF